MDEFLALFPFILSALLSATIGAYSWYHRASKGVGLYAVYALAQSLWVMGYVLELHAQSLPGKDFWDDVQYSFIWALPNTILLFSLAYTGYKMPRVWLFWSLTLLVSAATLGLAFADHPLISDNPELRLDPPFNTYYYDFGLLGGIAITYTLMVVLLVSAFLSYHAFKANGLFRTQTLIIVGGMLFPIVGALLAVAVGFEIAGQRDTTPFMFAVANILIAWGLFRYRLFSLVPMARDRVLENLMSGIVVFDRDLVILDANPSAQMVLGQANLVGQSVISALPDYRDFILAHREEERTITERTMQRGNATQYYEVALSQIKDPQGEFLGNILGLREITERIKAQEEIRLAHTQADLLYRLAARINIVNDYHEILQALADEAGPQPYNVALSIYQDFDFDGATYVTTHAVLFAHQQNATPLQLNNPIQHYAVQRDGLYEVTDFESASHIKGDVRDYFRGIGIRAMLTADIQLGLRQIGNISFFSPEARSFSDQERRFLRHMAQLSAAPIERSRLFNEIVEAQAQTGLLYQVSQEMNRAHDYLAILASITNHLQFEDYQIALSLFEGFDATTASYFDVVAGRPTGASEVIPMALRFDADTIRPWVKRDVFVVKDMQAESRLDDTTRQYYLANQTHSMLLAGILLGERVIGALNLTFAQAHSFDLSEIVFTRAVADVAASAIERVRLYQEQVAIAEELRALDQMKSQFLASMSHELRTPLNAILNFTQFMTMGMLGPVTEKQQDALGKVLGSGQHLLALINDVLDMTKIQAGMMTLFVESDIKLNKELETVCGSVESLLKDKSIRFVRDIDNPLPLMVGDRRRIRQILLNLLSNAAKFTEQGSITLSAKQQGQDVLFVVSDTGPGIAPEDAEIIFEPFRQTEAGLQHAGGTGLGLPISRKLAEAHGGQLWLESIVGEGASFYVRLPLCDPNLVSLLSSNSPNSPSNLTITQEASHA